MNRARYLVKHQTSGDVFVIDSDDEGNVYAESDALHTDDWSDNGYDMRPGLDLGAFDLHQLDTPEPDTKYRYLSI